eukprot:3344416-Amphidinium_carterae.2
MRRLCSKFLLQLLASSTPVALSKISGSKIARVLAVTCTADASSTSSTSGLRPGGHGRALRRPLCGTRLASRPF